MLELFQYLNSIFPLNADVQSHLMQILKKRDLPANTYWLREDEICKKIAFIEQGLVKIFYNVNNKEIIVWFNKESDIVISVKSFFDQTPSNLLSEQLSPLPFITLNIKTSNTSTRSLSILILMPERLLNDITVSLKII